MSGALALATPAEAAFAIRWSSSGVNSVGECQQLLTSAAAAVGLERVNVQSSGEVSGSTALTFTTMTCIPLDSDKAKALVMSTGLSEDDASVIATRDALTNYIREHRQPLQ